MRLGKYSVEPNEAERFLTGEARSDHLRVCKRTHAGGGAGPNGGGAGGGGGGGWGGGGGIERRGEWEGGLETKKEPRRHEHDLTKNLESHHMPNNTTSHSLSYTGRNKKEGLDKGLGALERWGRHNLGEARGWGFRAKT